MANYPNAPFTNGADFTTELADLAYHQVFDDQIQFLGHHERHKDDALSNDADAIKARVAKLTDGCKVEQGPAGLFIKYNAGTVQTLDDTDITIPSGILAVPDNTSNIFVFVDAVGSINVSTTANISRQLLARVNTAGGIITNITDLRDPAKLKVMPRANAIKTFGGNSVLDYNQTSGTATLEGEQRFRNFTLAAGATINVPSGFQLYCSGNVNIRGSIIVSPPINGGGKLFGFWRPATYVGSSGQGIGGGTGHNTAASPAYHYNLQPTGSGGGAGLLYIRAANPDDGITMGTTEGGNGGGLLLIEAAGSIRIEGSLYCEGGNGLAAAVSVPNADLYIINPGAGGGSGGLVNLRSLKEIITTATALISVKGGNGSPAFGQAIPHNPAGGGGGSGGYIVLHSPNNNTTLGTLNRSGGSAGANYTTGSPNVGGAVGGSYAGIGGGGNNAGGIGQFISITGLPV